MRARDLCALGAPSLPTRDLLALALRLRDDEELRQAEAALALHGAAREAALRSLRAGPQLVAVLELGRRAWMLPSPAGRRVCAPVDVAAVVAPRALTDDGCVWVLALDARLTLARLAPVSPEPGAVLRCTLAAGATRVIVARAGPRPAVPTTQDAQLATALSAAAALVGAQLLDVVLLGDDGFASLLRLGLVAAQDPRYR